MSKQPAGPVVAAFVCRQGTQNECSYGRILQNQLLLSVPLVLYEGPLLARLTSSESYHGCDQVTPSAFACAPAGTPPHP